MTLERVNVRKSCKEQMYYKIRIMYTAVPSSGRAAAEENIRK